MRRWAHRSLSTLHHISFLRSTNYDKPNAGLFSVRITPFQERHRELFTTPARTNRHSRLASFAKLLVALFALLYMSNAGAFEIKELYASLPDACHALSYNTNALLRDMPPNYDYLNSVRKFDIVCFGDNVRIDRDLFTNGGSLLIFADSIDIMAHIDTRIYSDRAAFNKYHAGIVIGGQTFHSAFAEISRVPLYVETYDAYYSKCNDCVKLEGRTLIPRMPDGLVPYHSMGWKFEHPGPPINNAPSDLDVSRAAMRSGDVLLSARRINFAPGLTRTVAAASCPAEVGEKQEVRAVVAGGIYGGRGGAGAPSSCVARRGGGFECGIELYTNTGLGGLPSRGGDGGDIIVYVLDPKAEELDLQTIRENLSAQGGVTAMGDTYRAPRAPPSSDL